MWFVASKYKEVLVHADFLEMSLREMVNNLKTTFL